MIYKFKNGAHVKGVSAQVAGETCAQLESEGKLTPHDLVEVSRPEDAPMHKAFEWNDAVAAERYREMQASYIIRSIVVKPETTTEPVRGFVSIAKPLADEDEVPVKPKHEYRAINNVLSDESMRSQMLANALAELAAFRRKYVTLTELAEVFAAIDRAMKVNAA